MPLSGTDYRTDIFDDKDDKYIFTNVSSTFNIL